jgi:hypothetical protein
MVVMQGETQGKWLHAIPKRTHAEPRIKYAQCDEANVVSHFERQLINQAQTTIIIITSMRAISIDG